MSTSSKCPGCGAMITSFAAICPECGYEFQNIENSQTVKRFYEQIVDYDDQIASVVGHKKSGPVGVGMVLLWIFLFPVMFAIFLIKLGKKSKMGGFTGIEKSKANAISMFPIPNSRNDLMEIAIMIHGQIKPVSYVDCLADSGINNQEWNKIWMNKLDQITKKSEIALSEDKGGLGKIKTYCAEARQIINDNNKKQWILLGTCTVLFIILIVCLSLNA